MYTDHVLLIMLGQGVLIHLSVSYKKKSTSQSTKEREKKKRDAETERKCIGKITTKK
jgi:hypothetical protein